MEHDNLRKNVNQVRINNPYNIIDVNTLSKEKINRYLMHTELVLYCFTDDGRNFTVEMQTNAEKHDEDRIFYNSTLKYRENYAGIYDTEAGKKNSESKYATLEPIIALNTLNCTYFNVLEALHFFRL